MPVNVGETLIAAFWDPGLSQINCWHFPDQKLDNVTIGQTWQSARVTWPAPLSQGKILSIARSFDLDISGYDQLVLNASVTQGCELKVTVLTDHGELQAVKIAEDGSLFELPVPLVSGTRLNEIRLTLLTHDGQLEPGAAELKWIMLVNTRKLAEYQQFFAEYADMSWGNYLSDIRQYPTPPVPGSTMWFTPEELEQVRQIIAKLPSDENPFLKEAARLQQYEPEKYIRDYVRVWDKRFARLRDQRPWEEQLASKRLLADIALIDQDPKSMQLVARTALSLASCTNWTEGMMNSLATSAWDHRAFTESSISYDVAYMMNVADAALTDAGKTYLMRRLSEQGIGAINYTTWRYEYIHHCNQLAAFSRGRIAAYLQLERSWPRVKAYTDLAIKELQDSLDEVLFEDGGFGEGPSYLQYTLFSALEPLKLYARARGLSYKQVLPKSLIKSGDYIEAFLSSTDHGMLIPIGDGQSGAGNIHLQTVLMMGSMLPDTAWATLARKASLTRKPGANLSEWLSYAAIPQEVISPRPFIHIPSIGVMSSWRMDTRNEIMRLLIHGSPVKAGHSHEDTGSFVLEYGGETFAADSDCLNYSNIDNTKLRQCQRHNMLVPIDDHTRPAPRNPIGQQVDPVGHGDRNIFKAQMTLTAGWESWYRRWDRTWDSPSPDQLTITDQYELAKGKGVNFQWMTWLPVEISPDQRTLTLTGMRNKAKISVPNDARVTVDCFTEGPVKPMYRINIQKEQPAGEIVVKVQFEPLTP